MKDWFKRKIRDLAFSFAWAVPRWLAYYCTIRVAAHATQGKWGDTLASELTVFQALDRWEAS